MSTLLYHPGNLGCRESDSSRAEALTNAIALAKPSEAGRSVSLLLHALAAGWIIAMLLMYRFSFGQYNTLMQEDRPIEWGTVGLFLAAGLFGLRHAVLHRRAFDLLVALFCLFVAGEEFSWGQRLLGFHSPEYFLGNNVQQELTLHNIAGGTGHTLFLSLALIGYGVLLPVAARWALTRRWMQKLGASAPPLVLAPWFIAATGLMIYYPVSFAGEWIEFLSGGLFLASTALLDLPRLTWRRVLLGVAFAAIFGVAMTENGSALARRREPALVECASAEVQNLLDDLISGAVTEKLMKRHRRIHKRVWAAVEGAYLNQERFVRFNAAPCADAAERHRYAVDPWGTSYWIVSERISNVGRQITIYSFGPNRRRDIDTNAIGGGDDIVVSGFLPAHAGKE